MRIIGLTGSIACGKSNVSDGLRELGATIIDGDQLSRRLTQPGGQALPALREAFGDGVFLADGTLDRKALGRLVFSDDAAREQLDAIMQPLIYQQILAEIAQARTLSAPLCVLDMPLLYEKGLDKLCHRVWCVYLSPEQQLARLMARDHLSLPEAQARIASQLSAQEKAARAQVVIDTSGSILETRALLPALYAQELRLAAPDDSRRCPPEA